MPGLELTPEMRTKGETAKTVPPATINDLPDTLHAVGLVILDAMYTQRNELHGSWTQYATNTVGLSGMTDAQLEDRKKDLANLVTKARALVEEANKPENSKTDPTEVLNTATKALEASLSDIGTGLRVSGTGLLLGQAARLNLPGFSGNSEFVDKLSDVFTAWKKALLARFAFAPAAPTEQQLTQAHINEVLARALAVQYAAQVRGARPFQPQVEAVQMNEQAAAADDDTQDADATHQEAQRTSTLQKQIDQIIEAEKSHRQQTTQTLSMQHQKMLATAHNSFVADVAETIDIEANKHKPGLPKDIRDRLVAGFREENPTPHAQAGSFESLRDTLKIYHDTFTDPQNQHSAKERKEMARRGIAPGQSSSDNDAAVKRLEEVAGPRKRRPGGGRR